MGNLRKRSKSRQVSKTANHVRSRWQEILLRQASPPFNNQRRLAQYVMSTRREQKLLYSLLDILRFARQMDGHRKARVLRARVSEKLSKLNPELREAFLLVIRASV